MPLLRLRSDEQLVAAFRVGSEDAFRAIHDRYRARLLAYSRQMLGGASADAEDATQDVFVRVYCALRADTRPISLRSWLYRIAHNRCVDEIRRPHAIPSEIHPAAELALSRGARHDPPIQAVRSEELARLIADVRALPEQQRSAILMRELQGLTYAELGAALDISVPAVKSLLLRARTGLVDATLARDAPCEEIHRELLGAHERGVRASGRARRHMSDCASCAQYRGQLSAVRRNIAALVPNGPLGHLGVLFGAGGGGATAGGGLASGGGAAALSGAAATKVAAIVCCAALLGSANTGLHQKFARVRHRPAEAAKQPPSARAPVPRRAPATGASPARHLPPTSHAPAQHTTGRGPKLDARPLTGQDMLYETPRPSSLVPSGVESQLTQTEGTLAAPSDAAGTPASAPPTANASTPPQAGSAATSTPSPGVPGTSSPDTTATALTAPRPYN